ncbi:hypothetical protein B224_0982 [Aeromonas media WS]|nr:hypothetical protein B224_0982 [Aeromonas media WS]
MNSSLHQVKNGGRLPAVIRPFRPPAPSHGEGTGAVILSLRLC